MQVLTASSISSNVPIPVDIKIGFPLEATYFINGKSTNSKEAILKAGASNLSKISTASSSKGVEKIDISISFA